MRLLLIALGCFGLLVSGAQAQQTAPNAVNGCVYNSGGVTLTNGQTSPFQCDVNGKLLTTGSGGGGGGGTVTSVGFSVPALSIFGVTGSPVTNAGTLGLTVTGTSGGLPYFSSTSALSSSALLAANALMVGGGAGAAPATITTGANVLAALGNALNGASGLVGYSGALGTITSGNLLNGTGYLPSNLATGTLASGVTVPVANLASSSTTVNGTACTLGSTCTITTGTGTVTSIGGSFTGGLISISGSPVTASGTLAFTVAGTSGGIPYFSSSSGWASSAALTANAPVIGGGAGVAPTVGSRSGNTTVFGTVNGTLISGHCVSIDSNLNLQDAGGACTTGGGSGTVNSGTSGQLTYYGSTGTAVSGNPNFTISAGILTNGVAGSVQGGIVLAGSTSGSTTISAVTSGGGTITLPASGTLATTAVATLSSLTSIGTIGTGVWQGTAVGTAYGGTGLSGATPFTSGGAFYATSASAMTTGTLPVTAGGTGLTSPGTSGNVLTSTGSAWASTAPTSTVINVQTFTSSGTWTKPAGYAAGSRVFIQAWGGGGSGGKIGNAGGGGGGGYNERWITLSQLGATETITIGAGGAGVTTASTSGNVGGTTTAGSWVSAYGGGGGGSGGGGGGGGQLSAGGTNGGAGGSPWGAIQGDASATLTIVTTVSFALQNGWIVGGAGAGQTGGGGNSGGNSVWGGGGGGAYYGATPYAPGTSSYAGAGGAGGSTTSGTAGTAPSGGGGGTASGATSGAGAAGQVIITVFPG